MNGEGLDAIVINTSGCGTTVKDYGHMFRNEPLAEEARSRSQKAMDISELLMELGSISPKARRKAARGLSRGLLAAAWPTDQDAPKTLLKKAGFEVVEPADSHLCCGSAGTYNLMQPEISKQLKARKVQTLEAKSPDVIAAGNIGCMMQIGGGTGRARGAHGRVAGLGHRRPGA
jgi:glycolate oxidase iron-sulfur subunit